MEITTVYQKERHEFGRSCHHFSFTSSEVLDEFLQDAECKEMHMERSPTILDIQAIAEMSEVYVNTETVTYKAQGMLHLEGGWPKDVDYTEKEQTQCAAAHGRVPAPWPRGGAAAASAASHGRRRMRAGGCRALLPPRLPHAAAAHSRRSAAAGRPWLALGWH